MADKPNFAAAPLLGVAALSVANNNRTGTGTIVTLLTVGGTGVRLDRISAKANAATSAGMIRFFLRPTAGDPWTLWKELQVLQTAISASAEAWEGALDFEAGVALPSGAQIGASTHNGETFTAFAHGGNF